jgi:hypothetical protein
MMPSKRVENQTVIRQLSVISDQKFRRKIKTDLPPVTLALPLNTFDKLLTMISAYGSTETLTKLPTVSSMMIGKLYLSARARRRGRSAERRRGFEGNSVKSASMGGLDGQFDCSRSSIFSSSSMSVSKP